MSTNVDPLHPVLPSLLITNQLRGCDEGEDGQERREQRETNS